MIKTLLAVLLLSLSAYAQTRVCTWLVPAVGGPYILQIDNLGPQPVTLPDVTTVLLDGAVTVLHPQPQAILPGGLGSWVLVPLPYGHSGPGYSKLHVVGLDPYWVGYYGPLSEHPSDAKLVVCGEAIPSPGPGPDVK